MKYAHKHFDIYKLLLRLISYCYLGTGFTLKSEVDI
jgi:hypothetical protein